MSGKLGSTAIEEVAVRRTVTVVVGSAAVLAIVVGSGVAGAVDEFKGQTYEQAVGVIGKGRAVVASRIGEYLPTEQCIVSGSRTDMTSGKVYLNLNCNAASALDGRPGNSVMTPEGKQVQQMRETAKNLSDDFAAATAQDTPSYCEQNTAACANFCEQDGAGCSPELMEFLGL
ncbi:MAG: hypothetical protein ACKOQ4_06420 [Mycobacterium sp.]